jgi:hypothetical protein
MKWLVDQPCALLIDELSLLGDRMDFKLARFIKDEFLKTSGRNFVYSSQVAATIMDLTRYMESVSNRPVLIPELPGCHPQAICS